MLSCFQRLLNYLAFQSFVFEHTWWRLVQKRVVRTKFDIYFFKLAKLSHFLCVQSFSDFNWYLIKFTVYNLVFWKLLLQILLLLSIMAFQNCIICKYHIKWLELSPFANLIVRDMSIRIFNVIFYGYHSDMKFVLEV